MAGLIEEIRKIFVDHSGTECDISRISSKINEGIDFVTSLSHDTEHRIFYFPVINLFIDVLTSFGRPMLSVTCNKKNIKRSHFRKFTIRYEDDSQVENETQESTVGDTANIVESELSGFLGLSVPFLVNDIAEEPSDFNLAPKHKVQYPILCKYKRSLMYPCTPSCVQYIAKVVTQLEELKRSTPKLSNTNTKHVPKEKPCFVTQDTWYDSMGANFPIVGVDTELNIPTKHISDILIRELGNPMNPKKCNDGTFLYHVHGMGKEICEKTIKSLNKFDHFRNEIYPDEISTTDLMPFWRSPYKFAVSGWKGHSRILVKVECKIIIMDPWKKFLHYEILDELTENNKHISITFVQRSISDQNNEKSCVMCCIARLLSVMDNLCESFTETDLLYVAEEPIDDFYAYLAVVTYRTKNVSLR